MDMMDDITIASFLQMIAETFGLDMALIAIGGGAIIGAIIAMLIYSLVFEIIVPLFFKKRSPATPADITTATTPAPDSTPDPMPTPDNKEDLTALKNIERQMIALRSLYEAGLIAPELYLLKSRELAKPVLGK